MDTAFSSTTEFWSLYKEKEDTNYEDPVGKEKKSRESVA